MTPRQAYDGKAVLSSLLDIDYKSRCEHLLSDLHSRLTLKYSYHSLKKVSFSRVILQERLRALSIFDQSNSRLGAQYCSISSLWLADFVGIISIVRGETLKFAIH